MRTLVALGWAMSSSAVLLGAFGTGSANAGQYPVNACEAAPGAVNHSWAQGNTLGMTVAIGCPNDAGRHRAGMQAFAGVNQGKVPGFAFAYSRFDAPAGTSIESATLDYEFWRSDWHWLTGLQADDSRLLEGCNANDGNPLCNTGNSLGHHLVKTYRPGAKSIRLVVACGDPAGCSTASTGVWPNSRAYTTIHSAQVVINDPSVPALNWTGGGLVGTGWLRGPQNVTFDSSDNTGINRTQLYVDGQFKTDTPRSCDYTYRVPCANFSGGSYAVDTRTLSDGAHSLTINVYDAAANLSSPSRTFLVDNTPPNQVANPTLAGGGGDANWHVTNSFAIAWTNPGGQASPITTAYYEVSDASGKVVHSGSQAGASITSLSNLTVPGPGDYTAKVWVGDQAGNVNPANKSSAVHLKFDDVAPGQAVPASPGHWIGSRDAVSLKERISMAATAVRPVSGVAGYSVSTDGKDPDGSIDAPGADATVDLSDLREGTTTFKARAVSGAGVPSRSVGTTPILVDKSAPQAVVADAPDPQEWQRKTVPLNFTGIDQPNLAGMTPAPDTEAVEAGGHIAYTVDDGPTEKARGPTATPLITADGEHVVTYQAVDAAGNPSAQGSLRLRIDKTPPERIVFEAPNAGDPRAISVSASDATSGIASGSIEMRQQGSTTWHSLPTALTGDKLGAQVDDVSTPRGIYELRATVTDHAGNSATGEQYENGSPATIDTGSLRRASALRVGQGVTGACHQRHGKRRRCKRRPPGLTIPFGKGAPLHGQVTDADGQPLPNATVTVLAQPHAVGFDYRPVGSQRTDGQGRFTFRVAPGSSRTLRFAYDGDARTRPTHSDVSVRVPASSTIAASRRELHVGDSVALAGRLKTIGVAVPRIGKLIDMEAFDRGRWRKFATVRTKPNGSWRSTYRFVATRGVVTYPMRAVVVREAAYPFETGASRAVRITVRGP